MSVGSLMVGRSGPGARRCCSPLGPPGGRARGGLRVVHAKPTPWRLVLAFVRPLVVVIAGDRGLMMGGPAARIRHAQAWVMPQSC